MRRLVPYLWLLCGAAAVGLWCDCTTPRLAANDSGSSSPAERPSVAANVSALKRSLETNLDYAEKWLSGNDFASLRQTAADVAILTEALNRQSDEATWQENVARLREAARTLDRGATMKNAELAKNGLAKAKASVAAIVWRGGEPLKSPKAPANSSRQMMHLVEALLADAKTSALVGDLPAARDHARTLSLASTLLGETHRNDADWNKHTDGMVLDALRAAEVAEAKAFRPALAAAEKRCADCHAEYR